MSRALAVLVALHAGGVPACMGPSTPLGAVDLPQPSQIEAPAPPPAAEPPLRRPSIRFEPSTQRVNGPYVWRIRIEDPRGTPDPGRVRLLYNGLEVTLSARFQFRVRCGGESAGGAAVLLLEMPHLRLDALGDHDIRVVYDSEGGAVSAAYRAPRLRTLDGPMSIAGTGPFTVHPAVVATIGEAGLAHRISPTLLAALIAQESSFDPHALSKQNALGLTQVTHLAEQDIAPHFEGWPRYPGIQELSRWRLRRLIPGVIHSGNEWRLDPEKSVWGGAFYLGYLRDRLCHERNRPIVERAGRDLDATVARAALAAYNSGLNRVLRHMRVHGDRWLDQRGTREAKRYVRKVLSYHDAFRDTLPADETSEDT